MNDGDYYVRRIEFPNRAARACVMPNDDGSFDIFLNTLWPDNVLVDALEHELRHIRSGHFYREGTSVQQDEAEAEGRPLPESPSAADTAALCASDAGGRRRIPLLNSKEELMAWLFES